MKKTIAVTKQWQIHIPKSIRALAGLDKPQTVDIEAKNGQIIISPRRDSILNDAGKYAMYGLKKSKLDTIRDHIDYSRS